MRYIDKQRVLEYIIFGVVGRDITCGELRNGIESLPSIDVVYCKDCMLNTINTDGATEPWCYKFGYAVEDTDFCSYGERKE